MSTKHSSTPTLTDEQAEAMRRAAWAERAERDAAEARTSAAWLAAAEAWERAEEAGRLACLRGAVEDAAAAGSRCTEAAAVLAVAEGRVHADDLAGWQPDGE